MNRYLEQANEEKKRVEHMIYVSLKYTRTVDIIKNIIERLINCCDFCIYALLEMYKEHEKVDTIQKSPGLRAKMLAELYKDQPIMLEFIDFYTLLRGLSRAEFSRSNEYRRHVTMTAMLQDGPVEINIDIITEYYQRSRVFLKLVERIIESANNLNIEESFNSVMAELSVER
ncbi:MAG: hypothetical protein ABIG95_05750 [Candidatus Woesearchaeota archaeon]